MNHEEDQKNNSSFWSSSIWYKIILFIVIYIISPGPVLYLLAFCGLYKYEWVSNCFFYFYFPHAVLALGAKPYQEYVFWWFKVSGVPIF